MNTRRILLLFLSVVCIFVGVRISSSVQQKQTPRIKMVTSIFPLKEFAHAVAGDWGDTDLLLPPGAEIHAWQPKPSDLVKLSTADVFVYIGAQLEPWAEDILRSVKNPDLHVIEASRGLPVIGHEEEGEEHEHGVGDPHIWLDFAYDKKIIDRIAEVLSRIDPDRRNIFQENADFEPNKHALRHQPG